MSPDSFWKASCSDSMPTFWGCKHGYYKFGCQNISHIPPLTSTTSLLIAEDKSWKAQWSLLCLYRYIYIYIDLYVPSMFFLHKGLKWCFFKPSFHQKFIHIADPRQWISTHPNSTPTSPQKEYPSERFPLGCFTSQCPFTCDQESVLGGRFFQIRLA